MKFRYDWHDWKSKYNYSECEMPGCTLSVCGTNDNEYQWSAYQKPWVFDKNVKFDSEGKAPRRDLAEGHGRYLGETEAKEQAVIWYLYGVVTEYVPFEPRAFREDGSRSFCEFTE